MNNKHGPLEGISGRVRQLMDNKGDPKNGRHRRGSIPLIYGLIVNRLTSEIQLE